MVKQLRFCDRKAQFWVLVKGRKNKRKTELRPIISDADIMSLVDEVPPNKELDIYVEHLFDDQWDYDVEISRELGDDCFLYDEIEQSTDNDDEAEEFRAFRRVCWEVTGIDNDFQQTNLNKEGFKFEIGMIFKSAEEFKWAVKCHEATRRKDIHFKKNEGRRVRVVCRHNNTCNWTIFASRSNPRSPFAIKTYNPEHTCGDQDENRTVNSGFLAKLYKDDFKINTEWGRVQFQEHVKAKLKCQVAEMEEIAAGMEQVVAEEVQVEGQFEDIAIETQVPSFVLDEMAILNSQSSQAVQNQAPPLSEFISAQLPTEILHDIFTGATSPHQQRTSGNHCVDPIELEDIVEPIELEAASCSILASTQGLELDCTTAAG
nr:Zinc knuckle family protein [Ipomoea batatas]